MPLTPAQAWRDVAIAFPDFVPASRFALALAFADGIPKKMCGVFDSQLPPFFKGVSDVVPAGNALVLVMVAPAGVDAPCANSRPSMAASSSPSRMRSPPNAIRTARPSTSTAGTTPRCRC